MGTDPDSIHERLIAAAVCEGLPEGRFLPAMTSRKRREVAYHVTSALTDPDIRIELGVYGSGSVTAHVTMCCQHIEDGHMVEHRDRQRLQWADDGSPALIRTSLGRRHLEETPCPTMVMRAFIDAIGLQREASGTGGYETWRAMMALLAQRIANQTGRAIEIVVELPPVPRNEDEQQARATYDVADVSDHDRPVPIGGFEREIAEIDERMAPHASTLLMLPPGLLVRQRYREIFHAGN